MNKYQEALNNIKGKNIYEPYDLDGWTEYDCKNVFDEDDEDIKKIQELVDKAPYYKELEDKATPFKPLNQEIEGVNFVLYGQCKCGCEVWEGWKFCVDCGQALDWRKDD